MNVQEERREKNNQYIKSLGIACYEQLPMVESSNEVKLKSIGDICKRAVASLISTQVACDIAQNNYKESVEFFTPVLERFEVKNSLNSKEKRIFDGTYTEQDAIDIDWEYETYWALCWALGLVDDIRDGGRLCDCNAAINFVLKSKTFNDFMSECKMRDVEEILDMLDLYYRYHWATTEQRVNPNTNIGNLNPSNVIERRRGLEWLISKEDDWYDINLDT